MVNVLPERPLPKKASRLSRALARALDPDAAVDRLAELWSLFFAFEGRIGRRGFWLGALAVFMAIWFLERRLHAVFPGGGRGIAVLLGALSIYPLSAIATKRGLDRDHSDSWGVSLILAIIGAGALAVALGHGAVAGVASFGALGLSLYALVEMGLMPAPETESPVGARSPR